MLSERINRLSSHLQNNIHDFSSRQGLLKMIGRRKRLLSYMPTASSATPLSPNWASAAERSHHA